MPTLGARDEATLTIVDNDQPALSGKSVIIDDFELAELPAGEDADGNGIGFVTWNASCRQRRRHPERRPARGCAWSA